MRICIKDDDGTWTPAMQDYYWSLPQAHADGRWLTLTEYDRTVAQDLRERYQGSLCVSYIGNYIEFEREEDAMRWMLSWA